MRLKTVGTIAAAAMLASGVAAAADTAQHPAKGPVSTATERAAESDFIKTSDDVNNVLQDIRATRVAIFNGLPDDAKKFAGEAKNDIAAGVKTADEYVVDTKKLADKQANSSDQKDAIKTGDLYVPFDADMALAENFVATPEKLKHVAKANEHLNKGDKHKAAQVLKDASIDVMFSAALLPVNYAQGKIDDAQKLIDQGKYYEANLALRDVENSVVYDSFGIDEVPQQAKSKS